MALRIKNALYRVVQFLLKRIVHGESVAPLFESGKGAACAAVRSVWRSKLAHDLNFDRSESWSSQPMHWLKRPTDWPIKSFTCNCLPRPSRSAPSQVNLQSSAQDGAVMPASDPVTIRAALTLSGSVKDATVQ